MDFIDYSDTALADTRGNYSAGRRRRTASIPSSDSSSELFRWQAEADYPTMSGRISLTIIPLEQVQAGGCVVVDGETLLAGEKAWVDCVNKTVQGSKAKVVLVLLQRTDG